MGVSGDGFWRPDVRAQFLTDDGVVVLMHYTGLVEQTSRFAEAAEADEATDWADQYVYESAQPFYVAEDTAESSALVERVRSAARAEHQAAAQRLVATGELWALRLRECGEREDWIIDAVEAVTAEVAAALGISQGVAGSYLRYARAMRERFRRWRRSSWQAIRTIGCSKPLCIAPSRSPMPTRRADAAQGSMVGADWMIPPEVVAELAKSATLRPLVHPGDAPPEVHTGIERGRFRAVLET